MANGWFSGIVRLLVAMPAVHLLLIRMNAFDNQTKFELFAGFAAIGGVFALVLAISSVSSASLERYAQRSNFRACMIEKAETVCTAAYPLGAIK